MKKICIAIITALLIICNYNVVKALTRSELEQKRIELQIKIEEAGKNIENIQVELTENLEAINALDEEIYLYEEQINKITENLVNVERQIEETKIILAELEKKYEYQKGLLEKRLVYAYKSGKTRYIDVLLKSEGIMDFISKYHLIEEIIQYDESLMESISREKDKIEEIHKQLETSKNNLKEFKTEQKKITVSLENSKLIRSSYVNKLTEDELKIKEELDIYQNELDLVELEILLAAMEGVDSQFVGGTFAWPAPGYYTITSPYGMRFHPVIKVYRNHSGMDIAAPTGSYAIAANDGIVTTSTYSYSYGNMVMIDHGGGVVTLYAHGSERLVQVGDEVKRGDAIMKVGSTGWSTGPHLHFEIRINGSTIDPYPYVTSSLTDRQEDAQTDVESETNEVNQVNETVQ